VNQSLEVTEALEGFLISSPKANTKASN
jgi:hypothetical protein